MADAANKQENLILINGRHQAQETALQLLQHAKREICFFGPEIDKILFDNEAAIDLLSQLARKSRFSRVRFAVYSTRRNVSDSHRLLPLAQRLSSILLIHQCDREDQTRQDSFLLVDNIGYLHCHNAVRYTGTAHLNDRSKNRFFQQQFDQLWARSSMDPNSRRLQL